MICDPEYCEIKDSPQPTLKDEHANHCACCEATHNLLDYGGLSLRKTPLRPYVEKCELAAEVRILVCAYVTLKRVSLTEEYADTDIDGTLELMQKRSDDTLQHLFDWWSEIHSIPVEQHKWVDENREAAG